jgi:hypothetical protein
MTKHFLPQFKCDHLWENPAKVARAQAKFLRSSGIENGRKKYRTPISGRDALVGLVELQTQGICKDT